MKLILQRHGIAEDRDPDRPDHERELTEKGRKKLEENVGFLSHYLSDEKIRLISSPLVRSVETARILTRAGLGRAEAMEFIADGDFEKLKSLVTGKPDIVHVITGHAPHLDDWIHAITDQSIRMKKGSACQIEITDEEAFTGFVTWYLTLDQYDRLVEFGRFKESRARFLKDIEDIIEKYRQLILEHREKYLKEPEEIESVHKLRVKIRQFRSLVSFFKPIMNKKDYREIQDILRSMAQECAYLREIDVITEEWTSRKEDFEGAEVTGDSFLSILKKERSMEQKHLQELLEKPDYAKKLAEVESMIRKAINLENTLYHDLDAMVIDTVKTWHDKIRDEYEAIEVNDLDTIHALRIRAKKIRYVMEVFELNEDEETKEMHSKIKHWQEVLGNITDANRNSAAVMEIAGKYPDAPIAEELKVFKEAQIRQSAHLYDEFFDNKEAPEGEGANKKTEERPKTKEAEGIKKGAYETAGEGAGDASEHEPEKDDEIPVKESGNE